MVSFARARTRSLLARLFQMSSQSTDNEKVAMDISKELLETQHKQNKSFFEAIKSGGMWFT